MTTRMKIAVLATLILMASAPLATSQEIGFLYVASQPPGARMVISDLPETEYITPALCTLAVGVHQLMLSMPHYRPETLTVDIVAGQVTRQEISFVNMNQLSYEPPGKHTVFQQYGTLTIISDYPDAKIYLDRDSIEPRTPVTLSDIAAGPHQVTLQLGSMMYDTTITIEPDQVTLVQASFADLAGGRAKQAAESVPLDFEIEIPSCMYRRDYDKHPEGTNIAIKGCDVTVRLATGRDTLEFSHNNLSGQDIKYDHRGFPTEKQVVDTLLTGRIDVPMNDSLTVGLRIYANPKTGYVDRDKIEPVIKSYLIPADFNFGEPIHLRLKIRADGTVSYRYF